MNQRSTSCCFLAAAVLVLSAVPALAQSGSLAEDRIRQRQAEMEQRMRDSRARIEAARRKGGFDQPSWRGPPRESSLSAGDARNRARFEPEYKFDGGREFAYRFVLSLTEENTTRYIAGYAAFQPQAAERGRRQLLVRDNLQETHSPSAIEAPAPGELTTMLDRTLHVYDAGAEPRVDKNLPALLGDVKDWFFPPLPDNETEDRSGGQTVIREPSGEWDTTGFYDKNDRSAKGYYSWSVQPKGVSGGILTATDKRSVRSDDGTIELVGEGTFAFDVNRGILRDRRFRGAYKSHEGVVRIALEITPAPASALGP